MIDVKITDDQLHAALLDFCQKTINPKAKSINLKFGAWLSKDVATNLSIKSTKTKQIVLSHKFCLVAKYLGKNLNEDKQNNIVIKNVKAGIAMLFKGMDLDGKWHIFKINSKDNAGKFFVIPFDVSDARATIHMKISF